MPASWSALWTFQTFAECPCTSPSLLSIRLIVEWAAIHTEVEFVEMYVDQPLFADVDTFLRGVGYQFHTLLGVGTRCFKPLIVNGDKNRGMRQFLWADVLYVKDFMRFDQIPIEKLKKLAVLLHDLYRSYDLFRYRLVTIESPGLVASDHPTRRSPNSMVTFMRRFSKPSLNRTPSDLWNRFE